MTTESNFQSMAQPLTADDVKAMRQATSLSFRGYPGESRISAFLDEADEPRSGDPKRRIFPDTSFTGARVRHVFVEGSVDTYRSDMAATSGVTSITSGRYNREWATVASLLKAGDTLALRFVGDRFGNQVTRAARLYPDTLSLEVTRRTGERLTFLLAVQVSPDNSAKMVRERPY